MAGSVRCAARPGAAAAVRFFLRGRPGCADTAHGLRPHHHAQTCCLTSIVAGPEGPQGGPLACAVAHLQPAVGVGAERGQPAGRCQLAGRERRGGPARCVWCAARCQPFGSQPARPGQRRGAGGRRSARWPASAAGLPLGPARPCALPGQHTPGAAGRWPARGGGGPDRDTAPAGPHERAPGHRPRRYPPHHGRPGVPGAWVCADLRHDAVSGQQRQLCQGPCRDGRPVRGA